MRILVDATTLIALGSVGELDRLTVFDGDLDVPSEIVSEVTTEQAAANLDQFPDSDAVERPSDDGDTRHDEDGEYLDEAKDVLDETDVHRDVRLVADVLRATDAGRDVAVVSDARRVRTVTRGLGATVTGTIGVVVRAVEADLPPEDGKELVRRLDGTGLHMTGELRDRADELIDAAGDG